MVFGIGLPPTKYEEKVILGSLNMDTTNTINFKNPFKESIAIEISMKTDEKSKDVFILLSKKKRQIIPGLGVHQIPFTFIPHEISQYFTEIVLYYNDKIEWVYPFKGITESISASTQYK